MELNLRALHLPVPQPLEEHVRSRLDFALGHFSGQIRRVDVRLADLNGPRGGVDKRCRVSVALQHGGELVAESTDERLASAVDQAAHRMARRLAKHFDRAHAH